MEVRQPLTIRASLLTNPNPYFLAIRVFWYLLFALLPVITTFVLPHNCLTCR